MPQQRLEQTYWNSTPISSFLLLLSCPSYEHNPTGPLKSKLGIKYSLIHTYLQTLVCLFSIVFQSLIFMRSQMVILTVPNGSHEPLSLSRTYFLYVVSNYALSQGEVCSYTNTFSCFHMNFRIFFLSVNNMTNIFMEGLSKLMILPRNKVILTISILLTMSVEIL